jgi:hypothetical protein
MSRPSKVTPEEVTVTLPEVSELHPVPLVTWVGTARSVVPEGTPALDQVPTTGVVVGVGLGLGAGDVGLGVGVTVAVGVGVGVGVAVGVDVGVGVGGSVADGDGLAVADGDGVAVPLTWPRGGRLDLPRRLPDDVWPRYALARSIVGADVPPLAASARPPDITSAAAPAVARARVRVTAGCLPSPRAVAAWRGRWNVYPVRAGQGLGYCIESPRAWAPCGRCPGGSPAL